jgi:hypothetical protein
LACSFRIHLPASLRSPGITQLRRYYGRSDFRFRSLSAVSVDDSLRGCSTEHPGQDALGTARLLRRLDPPLRTPGGIGSPCLMRANFRPFRLQAPVIALGTWSAFATEAYREFWSCGPGLPRSSGSERQLGFTIRGRLATIKGRIEFVILRTSRSPPVALHPAFRRRSYHRLQSPDRTLTGTSTLPIALTHRRT